jgi:hypothetical protein
MIVGRILPSWMITSEVDTKGGRPKCPYSMNNTESKFLLHGQFHRANGWIMNDCLGYIKATKEDAIETCNRLNPNFVIQSITIED